MEKIPKHLQAVLWSTDVDKLDLERDKEYIIHQVLQYGTFTDIKWLFNIYSKQKVSDVFVLSPSKIYFQPVYNFVKNYVLGLNNIKLDADAYTTSISGPVRQRATRSIK